MKTHKFQITNADTDSISFCKPDQSEWTEKEQQKLLDEINNITEDGILWDHDGVMEKFIIVAAKNYIMVINGKVKVKGSGLKATKKEPRLKNLIMDIISCLVEDRLDDIPNLYMQCAKDIISIDKKTDLNQYAFKITVTKKVMNPSKTAKFNEKIRDALIDNNIALIEGDKKYLIFRNDKSLCPVDHIKADQIDNMKLLEKLFKTIQTFKKILPIKEYPNLTLKRNLKALELMKSTLSQ